MPGVVATPIIPAAMFDAKDEGVSIRNEIPGGREPEINDQTNRPLPPLAERGYSIGPIVKVPRFGLVFMVGDCAHSALHAKTAIPRSRVERASEYFFTLHLCRVRSKAAMPHWRRSLKAAKTNEFMRVSSREHVHKDCGRPN